MKIVNEKKMFQLIFFEMYINNDQIKNNDNDIIFDIHAILLFLYKMHY